MENKKLIVIDLDGTALHDHVELNPETKAALMAAKAAGHTVVIATGRPARASIKFYQELELDTPSINFNGSYIHHPTDQNFEEILSQIPIAIIHDIFNSEISEFIENATCEYKDNLYVLKEDELLGNWFHLQNCETVKYGSFLDTLDQEPSGFILMAKPGFEQQVIDFLRANHSDKVTCRQWGDEYKHVIEVFNYDSNKGEALAKVAKQLNFESKDIIVFGDGDNDIEMFQFAGTSIAMENALDELKAVSTGATKLNTEGGVAHYLYEFLLTT